ncbi:MAG: single-stranded DNA-binding protein [Bacteroidetes bacterium]|nr:single-stranded DNA-binding protein [Bacteroidota bacterium]
MNTLRNRVQLIGNLGMDPVVKESGNGKTFARFSIATSDVYRNTEGKKVNNTEWHNLIVWGGLAETAAKYLKKGHEVAVEGKLKHRSYENSEGAKRNITEVVVQGMQMLRKPKNELPF